MRIYYQAINCPTSKEDIEAAMRELRVRAGTIELQVREYEQQGPPIIFLHFGGGNLMMWQRAIPFRFLSKIGQ